MEVVGYQIAIIVTVAVAFRLNQYAGLAAAVMWSIETFLLVYSGGLRLVQLSFIWGTYLVSLVMDEKREEIERRDERISKLNRQLRGHPEDTQRRVEALPSSALQFVAGNEHLDVLKGAIRDAESSVAIVSGWISSSVVDEELLRAMWDAIQRGVHIYIGYGFETFDGEHIESDAAQRALQNLQMLDDAAKRRHLTGGLRVRKFPTHEKILIQDDTMVVCGSNNWLSNSTFVNAERSIIVSDQATARAEGARVRSTLGTSPEKT